MTSQDSSPAMRLDVALVARGLADSRERAKQHIVSGDVLVNGRAVTKPAATVSPQDELVCRGESLAYVGRGGLKLEKALDSGLFTVAGAYAMDVGASTGGFTDCLLQHGARYVYAIDVGHGQLHPRLAADPRVGNLEGTDMRDSARLIKYIAPQSIDFCVMDVSFISVTKVLPFVLPFLKPSAGMVCLIKPQFEAGRAAVGKNGIVKDAAEHKRVIRELTQYFLTAGFALLGLTHSPITGGNGNIEYLALLQFDGTANGEWDTDSVVRQAHQAFGR